jgi:hypothetical protein
MKNKKKQEYEKNRPDRKFSSKWQTERPELVFNEEVPIFFLQMTMYQKIRF